MSYTIPDIITWAKISQYLSRCDIAKSTALDGGKLDERHPSLLRMERMSLEELYSYSPSSQYLYSIGNYVISLCGKYLFEAQRKAANGTAGVISNPSTGSATSIVAFRDEIVVGDAASPLQSGSTTYTLPYPNIIANSEKIELPQGNVPKNETDQFSYSIAYGAANSLVTFINYDGANNIGAQQGMLLIISGLYYRAVTPSSSTPSSSIPPTVFVKGDDLIGNSWTNSMYAEYDLLVFYNGIRYLTKGTEYTVNPAGGFNLLLGGSYTSDDVFVTSTNGLL